LFTAVERASPEGVRSSGHGPGLFRRPLFPLLIYYATTLGLPLLNGAYRRGADFREHALFVLLTPLILALPPVALRLLRARRDGRRAFGQKGDVRAEARVRASAGRFASGDLSGIL
jgi:hypothetical protein